MNNIHILVITLKVVFILLLLIINIVPSFTKESPLFIIVHDLLIIILCVYLIYLTFPIGRSGPVEMEKEDFLFVFIVCLMLIKTVDFKKLGASFKGQQEENEDDTSNQNNSNSLDKIIKK